MTASIEYATAKIVSAYVSANSIHSTDLPGLILSVSSALAGPVVPTAEPEELVPAVPVKKSITPDYIVCLEDGKKFKSLKRHLRARYGMTPEQYRDKWSLPADYPMVAPNYSSQRSALAKDFGLGIPHGRRRERA